MARDIDRLAGVARAKALKVGVAESLTSGRLAATVGSGENAKDWFAGGIVAYQMAVKAKLLGVPEGLDPCSRECALQLANGSRALLGADIAVSTTGVGGPDAEDGHEPGTVYIGWATIRGSGFRMLNLTGNPDEVIRQTVDAGLAVLLDIAERSPNA